MNENKSVFETLFEINVNDHIEKKKDLTYLSWSYAWAEIKKYPNATYKIHLFGEKQLPYVFDEGVGYIVFTSVTINDLTHSMWLPVMDSANKAMKSEGYTYDTKFRKNIPVEPATMFDVNKTIMRCLVKNLAMFGFGLYIYSGEDLPEIETEKITVKDANILKDIIRKIDDGDKIYSMILNRYKVKSFRDLTQKQRSDILSGLQEISKKGKSKKVEIKFKILGKPRGKQRPRMCVRFGKQITYTPKQTSEYGSQCAAPSGRCRRADEQEKTQRIANGNKQGGNVFDREVRKRRLQLRNQGEL